MSVLPTPSGVLRPSMIGSVRVSVGLLLVVVTTAFSQGAWAQAKSSSGASAVVPASNGNPATASAAASMSSPDELIRSVTQDILERIRSDRSLQQGDLGRLNQLVDQRVMPVVNFSRMTALTVGVHWRRATPEQQERLMSAFRELLLLTYADALRQVQDTTVQVRPARYLPEEEDVIVRTFVLRTGKEPIQLDYRLQKTTEGWKIYDFNVLGLWLVDHYRTQFAQLVSSRGIDGLIAALQAKNKSLRQSSASAQAAAR